MSDSRDERVMKIVDEALDLNPAQRAEFIRTACATDLTLAADVEKLFACQDDAQRVFDAGELEMRSLPVQVGPYRLLSVIGEGGMGVVWRAEQREPIRRTVAVKLIKLGMDTSAVIARFESERQALAMMDHPNVAKVFDAGATATGRPYFVMEYVAGEAITTFCDRKGYSIGQRLELFIEACEAVQHAHQKTLIHRDLKPSNILVAQPEGQPPSVKVIDFGVAKATAQKLTERTLFTEAGQLVGTPEYMSPEQAENTGLDVDTRSDIYSLGVVLYELISGALPFDAKTLRAAGFGEIQRIIREVDPPRPSTRLSKLGDAGKEIARKRQTQVDELARQLRGELEWIPLKAMRKEPSQRYATATELAQDVMNYLAQRPLTAGPESAVYRTRKFMRRNRGPVFAATLILVVLIAGIVATTVALIGQTRARAEAQRERDSAVATLNFLTDDVLAGATPENIPDERVRNQIVAAMITPAATRVGQSFKDRPLTEASVRDAIQSVLREIGRSDLALPHAEIALSLRRRELGENHPDTIKSLNNYGRVLRSLGRLKEAEPVYREVLQRRRAILGADHPDLLSSMNNHAGVLERLGNPADAEPLFKEVLERRQRVLGTDDPSTITSLNNYAHVLESLGRKKDAEPLYKQALERRRRVQGDDHPLTLVALNNYAGVLYLLRRFSEAEPINRQALESYRRVMGEDHPATLTTLNNYALVVKDMGRAAEAEPMLRETLERRRRVLGSNNPDTIWSMNEHAQVLLDLGRAVEAEALARETVRIAASNSSLGGTRLTKLYATTHAACLDALGRHDEGAKVRKDFGTPDPTVRPTTSPK